MRLAVALLAVGAVLTGGVTPVAGARPAPVVEPSGPSGPVDPVTADIMRERGVSLGEAQRRTEWQRRAETLQATAATELGSDSFGGVWMGLDDDRVKLGVVGGATGPNTASARAVTRSGLDDGADVVPVRYSLNTLTAANDWIAKRFAAANKGQKRTLMTGIRTDLNTVQLGVPAGKLAPAQQALVDAAKARFGDMLRFETRTGELIPTSCTYPNCDAPLRGGVRIYTRKAGAPGKACTGGFVARSWSDQKLYLFTAGHCVRDGYTGTWYTRTSNGTEVAIGAVHNWVFGWSGDYGGDMAILRIDSIARWAPQPYVFVTDGPTTVRNELYRIYSTSTTPMHTRICTTGGSYGRTDCGRVLELDVTGNYLGREIHRLGRSNICSTEGDSGAPVFSDGKARGLHVARTKNTSCDTFFQSISLAEDYLRVDVAHF